MIGKVDDGVGLGVATLWVSIVAIDALEEVQWIKLEDEGIGVLVG